MYAVSDRASTTLLVGEELPGVGDNGCFSSDYSTLRSASAQSGPQSRATATNPFAAQNPYGSVGGNDISEKFLPPEPSFGGWHSIALNYLMADGSVRGISVNVDRDLLSRLGSRNDGSLISDSDF